MNAVELPVETAPEPIALVLGEPFQTLPDDLYIPPDALEVFLDAFEGPLDLLLYLIRRQNLDILDIPIAQITKQYIAYIDMMDNLRLELAAEYLVMAALLAEIKSRMLLPRQPESEEEEEDPRAFLIRKLQEYEAIKKVAEEIDRLPRHERDTFEAVVDVSTIGIRQILPDIELGELLLSLQDVLKRAERLSHHHISKEPLSVRERMAAILEKLDGADQLHFSACFTRSEGKNGVVVAFLAILELSKERLLDIFQPEPYAGIHVRLRANTATGD
ncbi:segregation and condensation protein A [Methylomonas sp. MED-D]|uniref:Segregation and condensation protein A n=1 Tax=Methylomonas koyamae TaxID=702114 RepID=A0A177P060_9GAMM|nr:MULTISPECIES: ScpA family protein [Methylomonas]MDT4331040.1 ScpA family protein [Methylomonas sp. MV1]NJA04958.1 segregation/condensation protein A [Methylococcaceae bacterium WWC4]OAI23707.1 segregation and condensation protein A [Methylomonas koyamae]OHX34078.1 segregation/condensation protein A [Methylomonas sp. LWB]